MIHLMQRGDKIYFQGTTYELIMMNWVIQKNINSTQPATIHTPWPLASPSVPTLLDKTASKAKWVESASLLSTIDNILIAS